MQNESSQQRETRVSCCNHLYQQLMISLVYDYDNVLNIEPNYVFRYLESTFPFLESSHKGHMAE